MALVALRHRAPKDLLDEGPAKPSIDKPVLVAAIALALFGSLMVWSATRGKLIADGDPGWLILQRHVLFVVVAGVALVAMLRFDYRDLRGFSHVIYFGTLFLLLVVMSPIGDSALGAQRWISLGPYQLQPSELAKLAIIVVLAAFLADAWGRVSWRLTLQSLLLVGPPLVLIYLQPDLGTTMVFVAIVAALFLTGGAQLRVLTLLVVIAAVGMFIVVQFGILDDYQLQRLETLFNPSADPQGAGYQIAQSQTAIGAGGLLGEGLFQGSQTNLSFVPKQSTDFVFSAVGEQLGFAGGLGLIATYAVIVYRAIRIATRAPDLFGSLIAVGIAAMFGFQVVLNMGMTMGIAPVTGIPLPLISHGGSSILTCGLAIGLLLNVSRAEGSLLWSHTRFGEERIE